MASRQQSYPTMNDDNQHPSRSKRQKQHHNNDNDDHPNDTPKYKHVLVADGAIMRAIRGRGPSASAPPIVTNATDLLSRLQTERIPKTDTNMVATIYTYEGDAPDPDVKNLLAMSALLSTTFFRSILPPVVRHTYIIGVKHLRHIPMDGNEDKNQQDRINSILFNRLINFLRTNNAVAMLQPERGMRLGFIVPVNGWMYAARVFFSQTENVAALLIRETTIASATEKLVTPASQQPSLPHGGSSQAIVSSSSSSSSSSPGDSATDSSSDEALVLSRGMQPTSQEKKKVLSNLMTVVSDASTRASADRVTVRDPFARPESVKFIHTTERNLYDSVQQIESTFKPVLYDGEPSSSVPNSAPRHKSLPKAKASVILPAQRHHLDYYPDVGYFNEKGECIYFNDPKDNELINRGMLLANIIGMKRTESPKYTPNQFGLTFGVVLENKLAAIKAIYACPARGRSDDEREYLHASAVMHEVGEPINILLLHCAVQYQLGGQSAALGGYCREGFKLGDCCTSKNVQDFESPLHSPVKTGKVTKKSHTFNGNPECLTPKHVKKFTRCTITSKELGEALAILLNTYIAAMLKIHVNFFVYCLSGETCNVPTHVLKNLRPSDNLYVCDNWNSHGQFFSTRCLSWTLEEQREKETGLARDVSLHYGKFCVKFNYRQPPISILDNALDSETLIFVTHSLEKLKASLRGEWRKIGYDHIVSFLTANVVKFGNLPVTSEQVPPFITKYASNNIEALQNTFDFSELNQVTLAMLHQLMVTRGGNSTFANKKGLFDPAKEEEVRNGKSKGGKNGNSDAGCNSTFANNKGLFDPAKEEEVRNGNIKGGNSTFANKKGRFDPANKEAVRDGNSKGGKNGNSHAAGLATKIKWLEEAADKEEDIHLVQCTHSNNGCNGETWSIAVKKAMKSGNGRYSYQFHCTCSRCTKFQHVSWTCVLGRPLTAEEYDIALASLGTDDTLSDVKKKLKKAAKKKTAS